MTLASYISTNAVATTNVATSFRPSDREIEINISGDRNRRARPPTNYRASRAFSQKPESTRVQDCKLLILLILCLLLEAVAVCDYGCQGHAVGDQRQGGGPQGGPQTVCPEQGGQGVGQMAEVGPRGLAQRVAEIPQKARRDLHPEDRRAQQRGQRVIRRQDPRQVRVNPEQDRDPVQVQREGEHQAEDRVQAGERREAEEHAERVGGGGPLRRVVRVKELVQPAAYARRREHD